MINLYAYTYPSALCKYDGFILAKVGDSIRDVDVRIAEQGGASEYEAKIRVGSWNNLQNIKRDYEVHKVLTKKGLHHKDGAGTEWFKIPGTSIDDAHRYIDDLVESMEGKRVRNKVVLRDLQQKALNDALEIIDKTDHSPTIAANLCPRFGKTIWSLMLFNAVCERYNNRIMLLPAYWLSVHSSFINALSDYDDFLDIALIDCNDDDASFKVENALSNGQRVVVPISLHGDYDEWCEKHQWISDLKNDDIFVFADEGDFGTHTDNQIKKVDFLFS
jgi:hypothetical protein